MKTLEVRHLSRSFGSKVVHRDITFSLEQGEILGLMGASGGGKSLILKMIIGLDRPDSGEIVFGGENICALSESSFEIIRQKIGYVFQNGALFSSQTVEENLSYPLRFHTSLPPAAIRDRVNARLKAMDLEGTNDLYPDELSGGMEKRIGLARATMREPHIILLDEPTSGLDPQHVSSFCTAVQRVKKEQGISGIFVTHDVPAAFAISDRIAFLRDGRIYALERIEELSRTRDPWIKSFLFPEYEETFYENRAAS